MLAVEASKREALEALSDVEGRVALASVNGPRWVVLYPVMRKRCWRWRTPGSSGGAQDQASCRIARVSLAADGWDAR